MVRNHLRKLVISSVVGSFRRHQTLLKALDTYDRESNKMAAVE